TPPDDEERADAADRREDVGNLAVVDRDRHRVPVEPDALAEDALRRPVVEGPGRREYPRVEPGSAQSSAPTTETSAHHPSQSRLQDARTSNGSAVLRRTALQGFAWRRQVSSSSRKSPAILLSRLIARSVGAFGRYPL